MKPIIAKAGIGVLGAGTIGTGVFFATYLKEDNSYEKYLNEQGRKVLPQNSREWTNLVKKYQEEGDGLLISIDEKNIEKVTLKEQQLKSWCSENSKKEFTNTNDETYQRVSAWCTEPKTISQLIGTNNRVLDDTEPQGTTKKDEAEWADKVSKYKDNQNKDLIKEISTEKETTEVPIANFNEPGKLRNWCRFSKAKHFKHEKDSRFLKYLKWCTIPTNKS